MVSLHHRVLSRVCTGEMGGAASSVRGKFGTNAGHFSGNGRLPLQMDVDSDDGSLRKTLPQGSSITSVSNSSIIPDLAAAKLPPNIADLMMSPRTNSQDSTAGPSRKVLDTLDVHQAGELVLGDSMRAETDFERCAASIDSYISDNLTPLENAANMIELILKVRVGLAQPLGGFG